MERGKRGRVRFELLLAEQDWRIGPLGGGCLSWLDVTTWRDG